jgi:hypothetical protein
MRRLVGLFLAVMAAALANGRPHAEVDCVAASYTAWSVARAGSFDVGRYPELRPFDPYHVRPVAGNRWVSIRPPGNVLTALPIAVPLARIREQPPSQLGMLQLGKAVGATCVAGAACLFFLVCRRLAPAAAWPATILFAFGTCLFSVASQALWMHGPAAFWLCVALYLLTSERPAARHLVAAGCALGLAVLSRPSTGFFALGTVAALLFERRGRGAAWLTLGGIPAAALLCYYNFHYFGDLAVGGYREVNWAASPPIWVGLGGLLVAPSRGALVYSPALVLAGYGLARVWRHRDDRTWQVRSLVLAWTAAAAATVLFYARWWDWRGGWCYGPRYLCETMPVACLLFGIAYQALRARWVRAIAVALVMASVAVHFVGVHGHGGYVQWHLRHERNDEGRCLFELSDTQIEAHARSCIHEFGKKLR